MLKEKYIVMLYLNLLIEIKLFMQNVLKPNCAKFKQAESFNYIGWPKSTYGFNMTNILSKCLHHFDSKQKYYLNVSITTLNNVLLLGPA